MEYIDYFLLVYSFLFCLFELVLVLWESVPVVMFI